MKNLEFKNNYREPWRSTYFDREAVERYKGLAVRVFVHGKEGRPYWTAEMVVGDIDADGVLHELNGYPTDLHVRGGEGNYYADWLTTDNGDAVDFVVLQAFNFSGGFEKIDPQCDEIENMTDEQLAAEYGLTRAQAEILLEDEYNWAEYEAEQRKFNENYEPDDYYREDYVD